MRESPDTAPGRLAASWAEITPEHDDAAHQTTFYLNRARRVPPAARILVATAGAPESSGAVRLAALLGRRMKATVNVVAAIVPFPHLLPALVETDPPAVIDLHHRRDTLAAIKRQLARVAGTEQWRVDALVGWPAACIPDAAERIGASLIVMGAGEHGLIDRLTGTETAISIAHHARVPVLIVPRERAALPRRAVVAVDFTESSAAAARFAARIIGGAGNVTLVHVSMFTRAAAEAGTLTDVYRAGAQAKLDALAGEIARASGATVETALLDGDVQGALHAYALHSRADVVALGSHARSLVDRMLLGSIRSTMVRGTRIPVLIAPEPRGTEVG